MNILNSKSIIFTKNLNFFNLLHYSLFSFYYHNNQSISNINYNTTIIPINNNIIPSIHIPNLDLNNSPFTSLISSKSTDFNSFLDSPKPNINITSLLLPYTKNPTNSINQLDLLKSLNIITSDNNKSNIKLVIHKIYHDDLPNHKKYVIDNFTKSLNNFNCFILSMAQPSFLKSNEAIVAALIIFNEKDSVIDSSKLHSIQDHHNADISNVLKTLSNNDQLTILSRLSKLFLLQNILFSLNSKLDSSFLNFISNNPINNTNNIFLSIKNFIDDKNIYNNCGYNISIHDDEQIFDLINKPNLSFNNFNNIIKLKYVIEPIAFKSINSFDDKQIALQNLFYFKTISNDINIKLFNNNQLILNKLYKPQLIKKITNNNIFVNSNTIYSYISSLLSIHKHFHNLPLLHQQSIDIPQINNSLFINNFSSQLNVGIVFESKHKKLAQALFSQYKENLQKFKESFDLNVDNLSKNDIDCIIKINKHLFDTKHINIHLIENDNIHSQLLINQKFDAYIILFDSASFSTINENFYLEIKNYCLNQKLLGNNTFAVKALDLSLIDQINNYTLSDKSLINSYINKNIKDKSIIEYNIKQKNLFTLSYITLTSLSLKYLINFKNSITFFNEHNDYNNIIFNSNVNQSTVIKIHKLKDSLIISSFNFSFINGTLQIINKSICKTDYSINLKDIQSKHLLANIQLNIDNTNIIDNLDNLNILNNKFLKNDDSLLNSKQLIIKNNIKKIISSISSVSYIKNFDFVEIFNNMNDLHSTIIIDDNNADYLLINDQINIFSCENIHSNNIIDFNLNNDLIKNNSNNFYFSTNDSKSNEKINFSFNLNNVINDPSYSIIKFNLNNHNFLFQIQNKDFIFNSNKQLIHLFSNNNGTLLNSFMNISKYYTVRYNLSNKVNIFNSILNIFNDIYID